MPMGIREGHPRKRGREKKGRRERGFLEHQLEQRGRCMGEDWRRRGGRADLVPRRGFRHRGTGRKLFSYKEID